MMKKSVQKAVKKTSKKVAKKTTKKSIKTAVSFEDIIWDEVVVDRLKRPSMALVREVLRFQKVPPCIDAFPELIAEADQLHPADNRNRHVAELAKWQWCWSQLTEQIFSMSQNVQSYKTLVKQNIEISLTTGVPPAPPPELKVLTDRFRATLGALAYVAEKLWEEETYNERNADCFLAADAWYGDYEKMLPERKILIEKLVHDINKIAQAPLCPPEVQTYAEQLQAINNTPSHASEAMLLNELNLIHILNNLGWAELTRLRFERKGTKNPKKERVRKDSRNMQNQIKSLRKRLSDEEK